MFVTLFQDRARNQTSRLSSTTTVTVNVKDGDDQDPSFIYQGCVVLDGSCINPEYYATVSIYILYLRETEHKLIM